MNNSTDASKYPLSTLHENEDAILNGSDTFQIEEKVPCQSRSLGSVAVSSAVTAVGASSPSPSASASLSLPLASPSLSTAATRYNTPNLVAEKKDTTRTRTSVGANSKENRKNITDPDNFLFEPMSSWGNPTRDFAAQAMDQTKIRTQTRTSGTHPDSLKSVSITPNDCRNTRAQPRSKSSADGIEPATAIATATPLSYHSPKEIIDLLLQHRRSSLNQTTNADAIRQAQMQTQTQSNTSDAILSQLERELSPPTIQQVNDHISSDYFLDGRELERNVVIDYHTDRSYVYTMDLENKFKIPEFLFLDVPNSTYAARACGQYITNKFVQDLMGIATAKEGYAYAPPSTTSTSPKQQTAEELARKCNKSVYNVHDIFLPRQLPQNYSYSYQNQETVSVQAISVRFRLRYLGKGTHIHRMIRHNFMNGHECARGILIFIPIMKPGSPADLFWGSLGGVECLSSPTAEAHITNSKMDKWCTEIANRHGTYCGKDPESTGQVAVADHNRHGPYSYQSIGTSTAATGTNFSITAQGTKHSNTNKKNTKKSVHAKKHRTNAKKAPPEKKHKISTATNDGSKKRTAPKKTIPKKKAVKDSTNDDTKEPDKVRIKIEDTTN